MQAPLSWRAPLCAVKLDDLVVKAAGAVVLPFLRGGEQMPDVEKNDRICLR